VSLIDEMEQERDAFERRLRYLTNYLSSLDDATELPNLLKEAEDYVALFLNGGGCHKTVHEAATDLQKLILLKQLRLEMPHQSTQISDLDAAIRKALKK